MKIQLKKQFQRQQNVLWEFGCLIYESQEKGGGLNRLTKNPPLLMGVVGFKVHSILKFLPGNDEKCS